jgi:hypothetical protein
MYKYYNIYIQNIFLHYHIQGLNNLFLQKYQFTLQEYCTYSNYVALLIAQCFNNNTVVEKNIKTGFDFIQFKCTRHALKVK